MTQEFTITREERHRLEAGWLALAVSNGGSMERAAVWWRELAIRHTEPHRRYHNLGHIRDMLALVEGEAAVVATWFHDAIYDPAANDNEEASAKMAASALRDLQFPMPTIDLVMRMIRATATHERGGLPQQALLFLDADLAILGSSRERYQAYVKAIRDEFVAMSETASRRGRLAVLSRLLARPRIYFTDGMYDRFEQQARANVKWEMSELASPRGF